MTKRKPRNSIHLMDEGFHRLRNKIVDDLKNTWITGVYWYNFTDKDLLRAVIMRMQISGEMVYRVNGAVYEYSVLDHVKKTEIRYG